MNGGALRGPRMSAVHHSSFLFGVAALGVALFGCGGGGDDGSAMDAGRGTDAGEGFRRGRGA